MHMSKAEYKRWAEANGHDWRQELAVAKIAKEIFDSLVVTDGYDSNLERRYAGSLLLLRQLGEIKGWQRLLPGEDTTLRLPGGIRYTPDFLVVTTEGVYYDEVKGYARRDDFMALRLAADILTSGKHPYPQHWVRLVRWNRQRKDWSYRVYGRGGSKVRCDSCGRVR